MDGSVILASFVVCAFGLTLGFVYLNPFGFVLDGLGFMLFVYGLKKEDSNNTKPLVNEKKVIEKEALTSITKDLTDKEYENMSKILICRSIDEGYLNPELRVEELINKKMASGMTKEQAIEELYNQK